MRGGARVRRPWIPILLAVSLFARPQLPPAQGVRDGVALPPEVAVARDEAGEILSLPAFRHRGEATPLERLGRAVMGFLRRSADFLRRTVEFKYGTAVATGVSVAVLGAVALLLWRLRRRGHRALQAEEPGPTQAPEGVPERRFLPLSAAERAFSAGDSGGAAALLTDWFLSRAYEPERPPDWRTNRELLPDLRSRDPLEGREWEALVAFHEALRYAGSPPLAATVKAWLERARRAAP